MAICPVCHNEAPEGTQIRHSLPCPHSIACKIPWTWDSRKAYRVTEVPDGDTRDMIRTSGECVCPDCNELYRRHPMASRPVDWNGYPFLHVLCDGTLIKL